MFALGQIEVVGFTVRITQSYNLWIAIVGEEEFLKLLEGDFPVDLRFSGYGRRSPCCCRTFIPILYRPSSGTLNFHSAHC